MSRQHSALAGALAQLEHAAEARPEQPATNGPATSGPGRPRGKAKLETRTLYLPPAAQQQIKELALLDSCRPHDVIVAALDAYFTSRGRPSVTELRRRHS